MKLVQYPAVLLCLILAGCAGKPSGDTPNASSSGEILDRIEQARALAPEPKPRLKPVPVRRAEAWLGSTLAARYQGLRADLAIRLVAQQRPVRFNFPVANAPLVRAAPQPQTIRRHLDTIAGQADWSWEMAGGVLQVHNIETRQFVLSAQPGASDARMGLRNLHSGAAAAARTTPCPWPWIPMPRKSCRRSRACWASTPKRRTALRTRAPGRPSRRAPTC